MGEKPWLFMAAAGVNHSKTMGPNHVRFRATIRSQNHAITTEKTERAAPMLSVKKIPPEKAGPNALSVGATSELGMVR